MYTLKEIHQSFDDFAQVVEKKIVTTKEKLSKAPAGIIRSDREKELGFKDHPSEEAEKAGKKLAQLEKAKERITHYQTFYPQYKFITGKQVEKLCKKYGLLLAPVSKFKGEVPEFAIEAMEGCFLGKDDCNFALSDIIYAARDMQRALNEALISKLGRRYGEPISTYGKEPPKTIDVEKIKPTFKICATPDLLDTRGMKVRKGYKLELEDPIVLAEVKDGYLVIAKWGEEAKDEALTNEKLN